MFNEQPPGIYMPGHAAWERNNSNTMATSTPVPMVGMDVEATDAHLESLRETESNTVKCVKD